MWRRFVPRLAGGSGLHELATSCVFLSTTKALPAVSDSPAPSIKMPLYTALLPMSAKFALRKSTSYSSSASTDMPEANAAAVRFVVTNALPMMATSELL